MEQWDCCISNSQNQLVYAFSWYLDNVAEQWDALVWGDYLYVMPLVWNQKYGIKYIFQPFFTQQLGIFSPFPVAPEMVNTFLKAIPPQFRLVEMNLNEQNVLPEGATYLSKRDNQTYHLSLDQSAPIIAKDYKLNTKRNIQKASRQKLHLSLLYNIDEFIAFTQQNLHRKSPEIKACHYLNLKRIIGTAICQRSGEIHGVFNECNQLIAAAFFIWSNHKVIYLAASSSPEGAEKKAMFLLIDSFITQHAESKLTIDFEGSNLPGVARFYNGFGAKPVTYSSIRRNLLPWYIRLLKR